jgi:hypothetical protein
MDRAASDPPRYWEEGEKGSSVHGGVEGDGGVAGESGTTGGRRLVIGLGGVGFARGRAAPRYMLEEENGSNVDGGVEEMGLGSVAGGSRTTGGRELASRSRVGALCRRAGRGRDGRMGGGGVNCTGELGLGNGEEELSEIGEGGIQ